ncbi:MAG: hypothetical protein L3J96_01475 [Thermoplasmata archaeon]|nr:hypothetical protein [Thermoplasmata archaeon]
MRIIYTSDGIDPPMEVDGCALPEDRLYDLENDVWVQPGIGGVPATLGVTASLASFAGLLLSISYRPEHVPVSAGRSVATLESLRYTGAVRLPVDGVVRERNPAIVARPKLLNDRPYTDGWVVRFVPSEPSELQVRLETASAVAPRLRERIARLRIRCYAAVPDLELYEIGAECSAILARVDDELARRAADDVLLLVTDDPTSTIELVRWSDRTGHSVLQHRLEGNLHHFLLRKEAHPIPRQRGADGRRPSAAEPTRG